MAARTVLEDIIDNVKPKRKRVVTVERVVAVLNIASRLLSGPLSKHPIAAPLSFGVQLLLEPSSVIREESKPANETDFTAQILNRIQALEAKMPHVSEVEQQLLKREIAALKRILIGEP
jgi:hypothetical protein